jgi:hypothetical protein
MKTQILTISLIALFTISCLHHAAGQWTTNGSHIYNTNTGNVGIGNSAPISLLHVGKMMTEPTIRVQNLGGTGGATFQMVDNISGADWKFKATNAGGFKIRDNAFGLDVIQVEPNSAANSIYINAAGNVGLGTSTPAASAKLEIAGTDKGFLPPRLTTDQINAIVSPEEGLIAYNTSKHSLVFFDGTGWKMSNGQFYIGALYGGGIIFYIDGSGQHGLIAAPGDQSTAAAWGCFGTDVYATATAIGSGQANTTAIVNGCGESGIAARLCNDLVLNGYDDWFLPSLDELSEMYAQKATIGASDNTYWCSSEVFFLSAWVIHFGNGMVGNQDKNMGYSVRAIRVF